MSEEVRKVQTNDGTTLAISMGLVYPLTACCGASAKGGEHGIICRKCYSPIEAEYAGCDTEENLERFAQFYGGLAS